MSKILKTMKKLIAVFKINIFIFLIFSLIFQGFNFYIPQAQAATLLSDDFTGTTINTGKWIEIDTAGDGGTSGNIQQNGTLTTANGYVGSVWGTNALISADNFDANGLEISVVMTNNSDQLLGYGDYNFQSAGTKAYILDMVGTSIYTLVWNNGAMPDGNFACGTFTDGATYKMKIIAGGFEVYKNGALQCTQNTAVSIDDEKVFLQSSASASVFDDVLVTGTAAGPTAPGAPTALSASAGNTQVSLSWTAPASDGGSAITDYVVEYKLDSEPTTWTTFADGTSTNTTATVTSLTNDLLYNFRVSTVNAIGTSSASDSASATPMVPTAPGSPTGLAGVSGNNQVSLSWTAPVSNGGSAITDYLVEYKLNSEPSTWSVFNDGISAATTATVTSLTNDVTYNFRVSTVNAIGTSTPSSVANAIPGQAVPLTINNLALWLDASDATTITESSGLISQINDKSGNNKNGTATGSVRPTLVSNVLNGRSIMRFDSSDDYLNIDSAVTYRTVFVVAKSDDATFSGYAGIIGDFTGTSPNNGHVLNGIDGTTKLGSATSNYASAYRNGTSIPGSTGHDFSPLTEFWIGAFELSSSMTNTTSAIGMVNGGARYWDGDIAEVIAYSTTLSTTDRALVENYLSTKWGITVAGPTAPDAPTGLGASKGNTQISLSWTAPADDGGASITDYVVEYKLSSEPTTWSTFADGTSTNTTATVTGLTNDLSYDFRVKAVNAFGTSIASDTATKTPGAPTAPDAPTIGTATAGNTTASVAFSAPADNGGSAITGYTVLSSPGGFTATGASSPITVTGLTNGVEYTFTVTATNAIGTSAASSASNAITPSLLANQLTDDFTGTTINTLKWQEVDPTGKGGTAGKVTQNGTLSIADSYSAGFWGSTALISQDSFSATDLEISGVINTASNPLIGYGDYLFGTSGTKAYLLYAQHGGNVLALSWDGVSSESTTCGTATSGATFKMKIISGGFEVYKNGALQCTHNTAIVVDNKPIFLQTSATASTFDNIVVYGAKTTAISPGQVTGLSATGMNKQALLNWDAPASNGYAVISDYQIEYKLSSADTWSTFADGSSQNTKTIVNGLVNGSTYNFRVSAVNSYGAGTASATANATVDAIDDLVVVITGESNSGGIGSNAAATSHEVEPRSAVQILELTSGNFLFENLDIGTNNLRDHAGLEGYYNTSHGLELGLANNTEANAFPDNSQIHLIKTGHGGSQVSQWNYAGTYFTKFLQRTAAAKTQLSANPKWVVWMSIGINDGIAGTNISTFKTNLTTYINNIKADLPGAIIIMTQFQSMPANSGYPTINTALADVASEEANVYVVDTTTATGTDGANHWTYAGLKTVANLMTTTTKNQLGLIYPGLPTDLSATVTNATQVDLDWTAPVANGGAAITDYLVEYKTSSASSWSTFADGVSTNTATSITGLAESTSYDFRVSTLNSNGAGNATSTSAATGDGSAPTITSILATPTETSSSITWTTNEAASSIVDLGFNTNYASSTTEADTSTRVTSHTVNLTNLLSCTTYHYRVKSKDTALNLATSADNNFTTLGCTGDATVEETMNETVATSTGATLNLETGTSNITLEIPAGFDTDGEADVEFQVNQLNAEEIVVSLGTPNNLEVLGDHVYDFSAFIDMNTTLDTFDQALTLTIHYTDQEVSGLDETSLTMYYWNSTAWEALTDCIVDTASNTLTCTTTHFSTFAVFGAEAVVSTPTGGGGGSSPIIPSQGQGKTDIHIEMNKTKDIELITSTNLLMYINSQVNFNFNNLAYKLKVTDLDLVNFKAQITVANSTITLSPGQFALIDLNEDKVNDLKLTFNTLLNNRLDFTLSTLNTDLLVKVKNNPTVYLLENNIKRPIPNEAIFLSYNFKWSDIKVYDNLDQYTTGEALGYASTSFTENSLVKEKNNPKVYLISNNTKRHIPNEKVFVSYNFRWQDIIEVDSLSAYPQGQDLESKVSTIQTKFTRTLSLNTQGQDVRLLQTILAQDKEVYPEGKITGIFGPLTLKAVQSFQLKHKIVNSPYDTGYGIVGPKTREKLNEG